jgi:hypothetical protein
MASFYLIVLSIAVIFLIIILTSIGMTIKNATVNANIFPPVAALCPDYWEIDSSGNKCIIPTNGINDGGNVTSLNDPTITYGSSGGKINFSDPKWNSSSTTNQMCTQRAWARANNIIWSGVSNSNQCP